MVQETLNVLPRKRDVNRVELGANQNAVCELGINQIAWEVSM
jgi:hypothetical protein